MDRGAARSRKRLQAAEKGSKPADANPKLATLMSADGKPKNAGKGKGKGKPRDGAKSSDRPDRADGERPGRKFGKKKEQEDRGPDQYKAKAIRTAHALVYSQAPFAIPPPAERLEGVTRVDLEGSGCEDVSWLPASVTWLNLKGCAVTSGWDVVGSLEGLTGEFIHTSALPARVPIIDSSPQHQQLRPYILAARARRTEGPQGRGRDGQRVECARRDRRRWMEGAQLPQCVTSPSPTLTAVVSHSPNLSSLPSALAHLPHLAKLAFSHCPRLDAAGLPDLSPLPLLRDVKANNLPRLSTLPAHLPKWGTGDLALAGKASSSAPSSSTSPKLGDGLEVLDLGNCSLSYPAVSPVFGLAATAHATKKAPKWPHLRSLTLRANPLAVEVPTYAEQLQASAELPKLQIVDARRVKERARAGEVQESRKDRKARERRDKKAKPTGANEHKGGKEMRKWGEAAAEAAGEGEGEEKGEGEAKGREGKEKPEKKEKRRHADDEPASTPDAKKRKSDDAPASSKKREREPEPAPEPAEESKKKRKRKHGKSTAAEAAEADTEAAKEKEKEPKGKKPIVVVKPAARPRTSSPAPAPVATHVAVADPAAQRAKKPGRSETAVVGVVDVKPAKGGLDLKAVLGGPVLGLGKKDEGGEDGSGLGLGGW